MSVEPDNAQVRFPPPILLLVCLAAGWGMDWLFEWRILPSSGWRAVRVASSSALITAGAGLVGYCAWQFKQAQTHIEPWRATSSIITSGPYRYSRNPIYLAFAIAGIGIALAFNIGWMLAGLLVFVLIANEFVIKKEEKYLERKFGEAFANYRRTTRRWL